MRHRALVILGLAITTAALGWHRAAEAANTFTSELSLNSSTYTAGQGQTVVVQVSLLQISTGGMDAQVNSSNSLLSAGFEVFFNNPSGVAAVLSNTNIAGVPAFDLIQGAVTPMQNATLVELVTTNTGTGITALPGVLGTFTFTGLKLGTTQITVVPIADDFSTSLGDILSPTSATARINVVPEPPSIVLLLTGGPLLVGLMALSRHRNRAGAAHGVHS